MSAPVRTVVSLASIAFAGLLITACDEPPAKCNIARGQFAAKYTLVPGSATGSDCAQLVGDVLNVDEYFQPVSKSDPQANVDHPTIGIEPTFAVGSLSNAASQNVTPNAADQPYALGAFKETFPKNNICTAPTFTTARVRLPVVPEHTDPQYGDDGVTIMCYNTTPEQAPVDATYEFSNLSLFVTTTDNGTQFSADLVYSTPGCTAKYRVWAVTAVPCGATATPMPVADASTQGMDASTDIDAAADQDAGVAQTPDPGEDGGAGDMTACPGSDPQMPDDATCLMGIPDFATACDPNLLLCVPTKETPDRNP